MEAVLDDQLFRFEWVEREVLVIAGLIVISRLDPSGLPLRMICLWQWTQGLSGSNSALTPESVWLA
jgi:hypothetical protein